MHHMSLRHGLRSLSSIGGNKGVFLSASMRIAATPVSRSEFAGNVPNSLGCSYQVACEDYRPVPTHHHAATDPSDLGSVAPSSTLLGCATIAPACPMMLE